MQSSKILVTGGSGFIGTNVVELLSTQNFSILNIDTKQPIHKEQQKYWQQINILDKENLEKAIQIFLPDYVIHLAARTDLQGKNLEDYAANTVGTQNIISILKKTPSVKKVVFTSSMLVCKIGYQPTSDIDFAPSTVYGESKMQMEKIIRQTEHTYEYAIVRPTSIWGPWFGTPYKDFFDMLIKGTYFNISNNKVQKTYGFVYNTRQQIVDILFKAPNAGLYYLGDAPPLKINNWANAINQQLNKRNVKSIPKIIVQAAAMFGDILKLIGINFPMTSFRYKNMTTSNVVNLKNTMELSPIQFNNELENINITLNWIKNDDKQ